MNINGKGVIMSKKRPKKKRRIRVALSVCPDFWKEFTSICGAQGIAPGRMVEAMWQHLNEVKR
jgi:hypothetical protein